MTDHQHHADFAATVTLIKGVYTVTPHRAVNGTMQERRFTEAQHAQNWIEYHLPEQPVRWEVWPWESVTVTKEGNVYFVKPHKRVNGSAEERAFDTEMHALSWLDANMRGENVKWEVSKP